MSFLFCAKNTVYHFKGYCSVVSASNRYDNVFVNLESVKSKAQDLGISEENADNHAVFKVNQKN